MLMFTGCHHFVWRKQHSDTLQKSGGMLLVSGGTFSWQTRILSKCMHAHTRINKMADNLSEQTRLGDKTHLFKHTHTRAQQI
uniref:Uncharacterized protein n=1 Tax=Seriola lalandi dorsalis TaxID=1841481 RepID=A0A3B4WPY2_SERLL